MSFLRDIENVVELFQTLTGAVQATEKDGALGHYEQWIGQSPDAQERHADAGTFRSQVERLFALACQPGDVERFETITRNVVSACLTNRYYRPADYLSDLIDALERRTFLAPSRDGDPPLRALEGTPRGDKLDLVCAAWLDHTKIASLESLVAVYAREVGTALPYAALARFERQAAWLFSMVEASETLAVEQRLTALVAAWKTRPDLKQRFGEPARAVQAVRRCLEGQLEGDEGAELRTRMRFPLRLANVIPEERQFLIEAALRRLGVDAAPEPASPVAAPAPAGAPVPAMVAEVEEDDGSGALRLLLSCPKCGGAFTADDETVTTECEYCGSLLILSASERDEVYYDQDRFRDAADVLDTVVHYRVQAHRAELIAAFRRRQQDPEAMPSEAALRSGLQAFEHTLRAGSRVLAAERLMAPYWHLTAQVAQAALGRRTDGPKTVRVRAWSVESTVPAYAPGLDLRDRGLRLAHAKVSPLTVEHIRSAGCFLPFADVPPQAHREVEKWRLRPLEAGFEAVVRHGEIQFPRRVVTYRPYWLAELRLGAETVWVLADGAFRTIAGYPAPEEVRALLGARVADPLDTGGASFRRVCIIASRCPDCGHEQQLDPRHHVAVCPSCRRGLEATAAGIRLADYDHVLRDGETAEGDYLPFWRFGFTVELGDQTVVRDLPAWKAALFGDGGPTAWLPLGDALWIPAFRLLGSEPGDEAFRRLAETVHQRRNEVVAGKLPVGLRAVAHGASLTAAEAAPLGRLLLAGLHSAASAAQLNAMTFNRGIARTRVTLTGPRLTFFPFDRKGRDLSLWPTAGRVPLLLLEGGRELEALRVSVHGARTPH